MAISFLSDIGNPVKFDERTDPGGRANTNFKRGMSVVDLIPVDYKLNLANFNEASDKFVTQFLYENPIKYFQEECDSYGVFDPGMAGLRLWLTGETINQETISNNFENSIIEQKLNTLSEWGRPFRETMKAFGNTGQQTMEAFQDTVKDSVNTTAGADAKGLEKIFGSLGQGKHFSLPKVWKDSTYNPSLSLNVKLVSPYGDSTSVAKHVIRPLIQLLILGAPISDDGITYGYPKYLQIKAYGITNISIGYIDSISINRGGADTTYNVWRQPTSLDLTISIKPALNGFAAIWNKDGTVSDKGFDKEQLTVNDTLYPSQYNINTDIGPGIITIGNIIKSFQPVPIDIEPSPWIIGDHDGSAEAATGEASRIADSSIDSREASDSISRDISLAVNNTKVK